MYWLVKCHFIPVDQHMSIYICGPTHILLYIYPANVPLYLQTITCFVYVYISKCSIICLYQQMFLHICRPPNVYEISTPTNVYEVPTLTMLVNMPATPLTELSVFTTRSNECVEWMNDIQNIWQLHVATRNHLFARETPEMLVDVRYLENCKHKSRNSGL